MTLKKHHRDWLESVFASDAKFEEPMSRHTSLHVGGPAEAHVSPRNQSDLVTLVKWLKENNLPFLVVGSGTNLLVLDGGVRGVVISIKQCLNDIHHQNPEQNRVRVSAGASVRLSALCKYAGTNGFQGLNFALGIPGTVGGAIFMNAGTHHGCMADIVSSVAVLMPHGEIKTFEHTTLSFRYRGLDWPPAVSNDNQPGIIIEGCFNLAVTSKKTVLAEANEILKKRSATQPLHRWSAGCIFKNPPEGKTAGQLIDLAGLKGKRIGDAQVSNTHANFIINRGQASAADILKLKSDIQNTVFSSFKVRLETEVQIVGT